MHIENLTIHIAVPHAVPQDLLSAMLSKSAATTVPAIGAQWAEHGGIYAGISRGEDGSLDQHVVLCDAKPKTELTWNEAKEWADKLEQSGFNNWALPTLFESALLYANLRDQFDTDSWHWTATQYSTNGAWCQYFKDGSQTCSDKTIKFKVRAVRRFGPVA